MDFVMLEIKIWHFKYGLLIWLLKHQLFWQTPVTVCRARFIVMLQQPIAYRIIDFKDKIKFCNVLVRWQILAFMPKSLAHHWRKIGKVLHKTRKKWPPLISYSKLHVYSKFKLQISRKAPIRRSFSVNKENLNFDINNTYGKSCRIQ